MYFMGSHFVLNMWS